MPKPRYVCSPRFAIRKCLRGKKLNEWEIARIAGDACQSVRYAERVLKGRFLDGEKSILTNPTASFTYCHTVIKGVWPEGEASIASDPRSALAYSKEIIGGVWEQGETAILECMHSAVEYACSCKKGRWDRFEKKLLSGGYRKLPRHHFLSCLQTYFSLVRGRWLEWEEYLLRSNRGKLIYRYARHLTGRLPEALHQKMVMFGFDPKRMNSSKNYMKYLERSDEMARKYIAQMSDDEFRKLVASRT